MTEQLAPAEPYETSFEATVDRVEGRDLILDRTYFYAESGGQPADRGTLAGVAVEDVQKRDGDVVHTLATAPDVTAGDVVVGEVDEAFRTYCMRAHTASHVLYGAGRRVLSDLGYGGFDISPEKVRIDFETTTDVDDDVLVELERLVNRAVWDGRPVTWAEVPRAEALAREEIAFNTKTEEGVLAGSDTVRVVDVEGWDVAACGGTHVANTRELGGVTLLDRSNPGEGMTRVEFAVGPAGIDQRIEEKRATLAAARTLGTSVTELPAEVERLRDAVADRDEALADLRGRLVEARIDDLRDELVERDGRAWLVGTVDGVETNELGDRTKALAGDAADLVALVGSSGGTSLVVGAGDGLDANEVVQSVTTAFGGGGGGSPTFAQGGGLDADPAEVVAFLRDGDR